MRSFLIFLTFTTLLFSCSTKYSGDIIISNINIVQIETGLVIPSQTIVIRDNKIHTIVESSPSEKLVAKVIIDGTDKYIIPGLWDMHTHLLWSLPEFNRHNKMMIANGVTGFRDMWGSDSIASLVKQKFSSGELIHQRFYRTNHMLDGEPELWEGAGEVSSPEEAITKVDSIFNSTDADFIKVYSSLTKESFEAIAKRSKELGVPFMGHIPQEVPVLDAIEAGLKSVEHLNGLLMSLSLEKDSIYKNMALGIQPNPMMLIQTQSDDKIEEIANKLIEFESYVTPTFTVKQGNNKKLNQYPINEDKLDAYIPANIKEKWVLNPQYALPPFVLGLIADTYKREVEIVNLLNKQGVSFLAGTDAANSNPFTYAGFSLQEELSNLVDAGLTPNQALQSATINPAKFIGQSDSLGLVKSGFLADLVILKDNPLEEIKNTRKIENVISNGVLYNTQAIDSLLNIAKNLAIKNE